MIDYSITFLAFKASSMVLCFFSPPALSAAALPHAVVDGHFLRVIPLLQAVLLRLFFCHNNLLLFIKFLQKVSQILDKSTCIFILLIRSTPLWISLIKKCDQSVCSRNLPSYYPVLICSSSCFLMCHLSVSVYPSTFLSTFFLSKSLITGKKNSIEVLEFVVTRSRGVSEILWSYYLVSLSQSIRDHLHTCYSSFWRELLSWFCICCCCCCCCWVALEDLGLSAVPFVVLSFPAHCNHCGAVLLFEFESRCTRYVNKSTSVFPVCDFSFISFNFDKLFKLNHLLFNCQDEAVDDWSTP